jgi:16S rRNA (guanine966-N2)-methyltransferase
LRVIAGRARGRPLRTLDSERLRPTGDKVKGALFSLLEAVAYKRGFEQELDADEEIRFASAVAWPRVLDLYAGSGALGIEALSRGAASVEFVERDARARRLIQANLEATGLAGRATVHAVSAEQAVSTLPGSYDLILADPPYAESSAVGVLTQLGASARVAENAVLVWEHHSGTQPPPRCGQLQLVRTLRHGIAALSLYAMPELDLERSEGADPDKL